MRQHMQQREQDLAQQREQWSRQARDTVAAHVTPEERSLIGDPLWTLVRSIGWNQIPYAQMTTIPCTDPDLERFVDVAIVQLRVAARILREQVDPDWPPPLPPEMLADT